MVYCDGNSFSGNRDDPVEINGDKIYFRGRRVIDETLKALKDNFGLDKADTVLLTGCSAGGLATYLHTDYVHEQLKTFVVTALTTTHCLDKLVTFEIEMSPTCTNIDRERTHRRS